MDRVWWEKYHAAVKQQFTGALFSVVSGIKSVRSVPMHHYHNSGAGVMNLAAFLGVKKIIMLGYDMRHTDGKTHWHGDHPKGLANAGKVSKWPAQFGVLAKALRGIDIVNCSRVSSLTMFAMADLDETLCVQS